MNIKSILESMLTAAGFCDPATLRLVWVNPPLARLLYEHGLDQNVCGGAVVPKNVCEENVVVVQKYLL